MEPHAVAETKQVHRQPWVVAGGIAIAAVAIVAWLGGKRKSIAVGHRSRPRPLLEDPAGIGVSVVHGMSDMTSLRIQMAMDRRSKFIAALSNLMKKIYTKQDALIQNIK